MNMRVFAYGAMLVAYSGLAALNAADIDGTVIVKHTLTKRKVTLSAGPYERGAVVGLGTDSPEDPLDYERRHVVVYIDGDAPGGHAQTTTTAVMDQKNRRFVPDLLAIPAGGAVSFPNLDPIFHNVFSLSKPKGFDLGNYPAGQTRVVAFPNPGIVLVNCRLHSNMSGAVIVTPNRWNTIAAADGRFTLRDVPPGTYTVVAWHKSAGFFRQRVDVTASGGARTEFLIPLGEAGPLPLAKR